MVSKYPAPLSKFYKDTIGSTVRGAGVCSTGRDSPLFYHKLKFVHFFSGMRYYGVARAFPGEWLKSPNQRAKMRMKMRQSCEGGKMVEKWGKWNSCPHQDFETGKGERVTSILRHTGMHCANGLLFHKKSPNIGPIFYKTNRHVNATKSYLHFGRFAEAILCSNFFCFLLFLDVLFLS